SEKAIAHASRELTKAERNYSQIEKEALALIFAIKKFHQIQITLLTDHKPLLAVFDSKKGIPVYTANRLQRWATTLLGYDFDIEYRATTNFGHADALSRLIAEQPSVDEDIVTAAITMEEDACRTLADAVRPLPVTASEVANATKRDTLLSATTQFINKQWPKQINDARLQQLFNRRDSLSVINGCLLTADRVIIPYALQSKVLRQLHTGYPGINRMKALARSYVYWPGIDKDIEAMVRHCQPCALALKDPVKTNLASWPIPDKPWSRIHIDYAGPFEGHYFLVVVDAHSKWHEIFMTDQSTASTTLKLLRQLFAQFGMPEVIVSDNGTQFTSTQFADFCKRNGIEHIFSPPYHPQSNGQAERFVDTFKRTMSKLRGEETTAEALQTFLLSYRTTPNATLSDRSPAEVLLGRRLRTSLDLIRPTSPTPLRRDNVMEHQFNRAHGARNRSFARGDFVLVRNHRSPQPQWTNGQILRRHGRVLYDVQVGSDVWRRHTNQLRRCHQVPDNAAADRPLSTLLNDFNVQRIPPATVTLLSDASADEQTVHREQNHNQQPTSPARSVRRSSRQCRAPRRLTIDPACTSYR
ncbi:hypothetical protein AB6A40_007998, partial [Gnathostoma spinigerum]